jgi:uncharacterized Zn finger protein
MNVYPVMGEDVIQAWVGTKAFHRGIRYFDDDSILNPRRRGSCLIAECLGSQPTPYRVEIELNADGIAGGVCTCTAGEGGHCKHAAALLLAWVHEPGSFSVVPELETILVSRSKPELITLIQLMVSRHPDLEQLVEINALSSLDEGQQIQPDTIVQQIRRAFSVAGGEWGSHTRIAENLQPVLDLGTDLLDREDVTNAMVIFQTLMESLLAYEDSLYNDETGDLGQVLAESEQGLQECLGLLTDPEKRMSLLRTLFEFFQWDLHGGGLGFADETPAILVNQSTPEEKAKIAAWIQAELPDGDAHTDQHRRRMLGGLWLDLLSGQMDDDQYLQICAETGRSRDQVNRLLSIGRVDEALETARREQGYAVTAMADLFEQHGLAEQALQLVHEQASSESDMFMLDWLKQYAMRHNQSEEALRLGELLFWQAQSMDNYQALLQAASIVDQRDALRERVQEGLERAGNFSLLVEIHLSENDTEQALSALEKVNPELWGSRMTVLRRQVAQAIEHTQPREALRLYLLLVEELIDQRSRGSYAEAARILQHVNRLYQHLGEPHSWERLIAGFNEEYRRLPALQDELRRAGL